MPNLKRVIMVASTTITVLLGVLFLSVFSQFSSVHAAQTIPYKINFQGRLTDNNGNIVADGLYNIRFTIYDASSGGSNLWQETRQTGTRVQITNGLFDVRFGDVTPLSPDLFDEDTQLYLQVELPSPATATCSGGGCASYTEGPLSPRQPIAASPYAFNADKIDGVDGSQLARVDQGNTFTGNQTVNGELSATSLLQNGNDVCDDSNNCSYATSTQFANAVLQGGNTFGTSLTIGTNDNQSLVLETSGTPAVTILANGNVGVGNVSPAAKLHVNGRIVGGTDITPPGDTTQGLTIGDNANIFNRFGQSATNNTGYGWVYDATPADAWAWLYTYAYSNDIRIDAKNVLLQATAGSTGNVGIGTTTPSEKLSVTGNGTFTGTLTATSFSGSGASLTALNASNISTGTLAVGRLDASVSLLGQTIESAEITDSTIVSADVAANTLTAADLANNSVDSGEIVAASVDESHLNITNTASAGQVLQFGGSNNFTWVDPSTLDSDGVDSLNSLTGDLAIQGNSQIAVGTAGSNINLSIQGDSIGNAQLEYDTGQALTTTSSPTFNSVTATTFSGNGAALTNLNASNLASGTVATGLLSGSYTGITGTGALTAGSIGSGFGNINIGANTFTGNGSGLTALNASNISTGTLAVGRLDASVSLLGQSISNAEVDDDLTISGSGSVADGALSSNIARLNTNANFTGTNLQHNGNNVCHAGNNCGYVSSSTAIVQGGNSFGAAMTIGTNDNQSLNLETNGNPALTILGNGDVGIGTSSPTYKLQVHDSGQSDIAITTNTNVGSGNTTSLTFVSDADGTPAVSTIGQFGDGSLRFGANLVVPQMTLTTSGNLGIGTTGASEKLEVVGNGLFSGSVTASSFSGNGSALTNLNATNLASGTVNTARISGSYTGITGTGALTAGSIASGFGNINIGSNTFTGNGSGLTTLNASNLSSGTVNTARISGSYTGITGTGALTAGSIGSGFGNINIGASIFTGDGSGLTALNGSSISTGTVGDGRLSSNVALYNAATANFTGILQQGGSNVCHAGNNCAYASSSDAVLQGGNSFGTAMTIGTNSNHALIFETNNVEEWRITTSGVLQGSGASTVQSSAGTLTLASGGSNGNVEVNSSGSGNIWLNSMASHETEGTVYLGRSDGNSTRYNSIKSYNTNSAAANNYLKLGVHNAVSGSVDVLTLRGDGSTELAGNAAVGGNLAVSGTVNTNTLSASALTFSGANPVISASTTNTGLTLGSNGSGALTLDSGTTGSINIGAGSDAKAINIGTGSTGAKTITIGSVITGTNISLVSAGAPISLATLAGDINLNTAGSGTINVGSTAVARSVNLGTGAAAQTVTLGSTNTTSSTTIQSGSGGISLSGSTAVTTGDLNVVSGTLQTAGTTRITNAGVLQNVTANTSILTAGTLAVNRGGTGAATHTAGGVLFGNGTSAIQNSGVLTNGQLLIGDGSGAPTVGTLTAGTGISVTPGAGSITIAVGGTVTLQGNTFNGASQLVQLNASSQLPVVSGVNLTNLNASNLASGNINAARISGTYNNINGVGTLTTGAIGSGFGNINIGASVFTGDGSGLTNLDATDLTGTIADARLSSNVAKLNTNANFTGTLQQNGNDVCTTAGNCPGGGSLQDAYDGGGSIQLAASGDDLQITNDSGKEILFASKTTGYIGMGTITPSAKLEIVADPPSLNPDINDATFATSWTGTVVGAAESINFSPDGSKLLTLESNAYVLSYDVSSPHDVSSASWNSDFFTITTQTSTPVDVASNSSGTRMYVLETNTGKIYQYDLSNPWEVASATYDDVYTSTQADTATNVTFKPDGTKMYMTDPTDDRIYQYTLGTPWDVTTATYDSASFLTSSQSTNPTSMFLNSTGTKLYVMQATTFPIFYQYTLSTPWAISSATYDSISLTATAANTGVLDATMSSDDERFYATRSTVAGIAEYHFDISTPSGPLVKVGGEVQADSLTVGGSAVCTISNNCSYAPSSGSSNYIQNNTSFQNMNIAIQSASSGTRAAIFRGHASQSGNIFEVQNSSSTVLFGVSNVGAVTVRTSTNSASAFTVQNSGGTSVFNVNTSTPSITLGSSGTAFGALKSRTINWNPPNTANGTTSTNIVDTGLATSDILVGVGMPNTPCSGGFGCAYAWTGGSLGTDANASKYSLAANGISNQQQIEMRFANANGNSVDPGNGVWTIWYIEP